MIGSRRQPARTTDGGSETVSLPASGAITALGAEPSVSSTGASPTRTIGPAS